MMARLYLCNFILYFSFFSSSHAQHQVPLENFVKWQIEKNIINENYSIHTGYQPYSHLDLDTFFSTDSILLRHLKSSTAGFWLLRKLRKEHLAEVHGRNLTLNLDILFDFQLGREHETGKNMYRNTRGGKIEGRLGEQITFFSEFYENQAGFPSYVDSFIRDTWIVPGQGVKRDFKQTGFDFNWAQGGFLWSPIQFFQFELAHGKKFIGHGYRSLLLSDNAFNYPHVSVIFKTRKFKYVKAFASLMHDIHNVNRGNYLFDRKSLTWHYLNFNFLQGDLQLSLFEGNMWANPGSTGRFNFNPQYINPLPLVNSFSKNNHSLIGLNLSAHLFNTFQVYGQWILDDNVGEENHPNKTPFGFQAGFKYFDAFGLNGLFMLTEYNQVTPYTYASANGLTSYSHYNQPLAHTLGANFRETVFLMHYRCKSILLKAKVNIINYGEDSEHKFNGRDILEPVNNLDNNKFSFLQGIKTNVNLFSVECSYILHPLTNMNISLGYQSRNFDQLAVSNVSSTIFVAFRTSLSNFYYDF